MLAMLFIKQIKCHFIIRYVSVGFLCWFGKCRRCVSICVALPVTNAFVNQNCKLTCSVHYTGCITANLRICIWSKRRIKRNTQHKADIYMRAHTRTHSCTDAHTYTHSSLTHARTHTSHIDWIPLCKPSSCVPDIIIVTCFNSHSKWRTSQGKNPVIDCISDCIII